MPLKLGKTDLLSSSHLVGAVAAFLVVVVIFCLRAAPLVNVPGQVDRERWVLQDFRDGVYYPVVAFLNGDNPYDPDIYRSKYPVLFSFPPYSPLTLVIHLPFGLLPHSVSQLLFFAMTIGLTILLSRICLAMSGSPTSPALTVGLGALILASRPGYQNLLTGQTAVELVLGVYVALHFATRSPTVSGIGVAIATVKPTFGLPLIVLMASLKHYRAVASGLGIALIPTLVPMAIVMKAGGGLVPFAGSIRKSYGDLMSAEGPVLSWARVDAVALISRLWGAIMPLHFEILITITIIAVACAATRKVSRIAPGQAANRFAGSVAVIAILIAMYQLTYCALLIAFPLSALVAGKWVPDSMGVPPRIRFVLLALLGVPAANYLTSATFLQHLSPRSSAWLILASVNGVSLLLAFGIYVWIAFHHPTARHDTP